MDLSEFRKSLIESINAEYYDESERKDAYMSEVIKCLEDSGQCSDYTPVSCSVTGSRNKKLELDGFSFDELDMSLTLFLGKYSGGDIVETLIKTEIERQLNKVVNFVESVYDGSIFLFLKPDSNEYNVANFIGNKRQDIERYNYVLITDDVLSERVIKNVDIEFIDGKQTQIVIWDIKRFFDLSTTDDNVEDSEIIFENYGVKGISCIKANEITKGADYTAYLCIMPGKLLSDIFSVYGGKLLESNVRSFLSAKGKVNKGIKNTIGKEPNRFFAYNNGISTTATEANVVSTEDGLMITSIKSLQIVNGGQTTVSIYSASQKDKVDLSDIYVPMKLCVISPENSEEITHNISVYSNSQNSVSAADFFSNSPFHVKIEKISRRLDAPPKQGSIYPTKWYYERARGSYSQAQIGKTPAELKDFLMRNPKNQVITKTDLARYRNTFDMYPDVVSKGPQKNIRQFAEEITKIWNSTSIHGSKINDSYYKDTVAMAIIFNSLDKIIANKQMTPWYVSGFKQNIVIYTISKFVHDLKNRGDGYVIDYDRIWRNQSVPEAMMRQLHSLAKVVFDILTDPERTKQLIPEYAKTTDCWNKVRIARVQLNNDVNEYTISMRKNAGEVRRTVASEAHKERINLNIWVVQQGSGYWETVYDWAINNSYLSVDEKSVIKVAIRMDSTHKPPTEKQGEWIAKINNKLIEEGFDGVKAPI